MPCLVDYNLIFLKKSWIWLSDPEIKALTLTPDFTEEDQLNFFNSLPGRKNYWIKGILENDMPIGVIGLKNIDIPEKSAEYWGYIGEKEFWGKGIGKFMMNQAFKKAKDLGLKKLFLKVSNQNIRAKNLYVKMDFKIISSGEIEQYVIAL